MIVLQTSNQVFTITLQGDTRGSVGYGVYTRSRSMLRIHYEGSSPAVHVYTIVVSAGGTTYSRTAYYSDPDGNLELPLRNIINKIYDLLGSGTLISVAMSFADLSGTVLDTSFTVGFDPYEGISWQDALAPIRKGANVFAAEYTWEAIEPPAKMFNPALLRYGQQGQGIIAESNLHVINASIVPSYAVSGVASTITPTGDRSSQLVIPYNADTLSMTDGTDTKKWPLEKSDPCADWALVRWTSLTGAVRQHYFPVVAFINGVDQETAIVSPGDGYDVRKNAYKGVRCRLTGLSPYDCWYYQDLLQASDAHAMLGFFSSGLFDTQMASKQTSVDVEGGMDATPEGNGYSNFEFTIKIRHYDTV